MQDENLRSKQTEKSEKKYSANYMSMNKTYPFNKKPVNFIRERMNRCYIGYNLSNYSLLLEIKL